jgi:hypothetical protein
MKKILTKSVMAIVGAAFLLPASGSASVIFTLSSSLPYQINGSSVSGTGANETVTVDFSNLQVNNNGTITNYAGSYVETYTNNGSLTLTGTNGISMTVSEAANLAGTFTGNSVQLYSGVTSLVFNAAFLTELGQTSNPALANTSNGNFGVTANGAQVTSAVSTLQINSFVATPEPSSFAMLGIALLFGIGLTGVQATRRREPVRNSRI